MILNKVNTATNHNKHGISVQKLISAPFRALGTQQDAISLCFTPHTSASNPVQPLLPLGVDAPGALQPGPAAACIPYVPQGKVTQWGADAASQEG